MSLRTQFETFQQSLKPVEKPWPVERPPLDPKTLENYQKLFEAKASKENPNK